jgi:DNA (cytosine-5)-methyltransferase 1
MAVRYIDVCSGISAPTMAWKPLGWQALCFAEIEAAPRSVLAHHYPDVPLNGDFTQIKGNEYGPVDLLVGGTPCQSFSVAGLRGGLGDDRGNLALEYLRLADRARPRWLVWENVPGVLSSNGGRDFGAILGGMVELGYGIAYRVLDAQHFGVPQRRRRVFVVGYLGDWRRAAAVLFERHSLSGDTPPRREKREGASLSVIKGAAIGRQPHNGPQYGDTLSDGTCYTLQCNERHAIASTGDISHCLNAGGMGQQDFETETFIAHSLRGEGFDASEDGTGRGTPLVPVHCREIAGALTSNYGKQPDSSDTALGPNLIAFSAKDHGADAMHDCSPTLRAGGHSGSHANAGVMPAVAFAQNTRDELREMAVVGALAAQPGMKQQIYIRQSSAVRRLTPRECERLQGFPDDWTAVPHRGKPMADGPRYKMLGNSMAVPVVRWIGERIAMVEALQAESLAA